jgi:serine/threonine protein kinase/tetratricopeptide (TPR) repeat protein
MALSAGTRLGHYEILAPLGAGGMGEVYRATDTKLGRQVALKVLPPEMASSPERLERFQREAKALAALDHPGIVTVHSVEETDGVHFLTMQLVEGQSLDELIPEGGLGVEQLMGIASSLAGALASAHEKGIVHRDLKPANVMVTKDGRVKVLDFGLAKVAAGGPGGSGSQLPTEAQTRDGMVLGTVPYMSPEQVEGRPADHRTDVYALGVLLFEMATGRRPFQAESTAGLMSAILRDAAPSVAALRADVPDSLRATIEGCLRKDPARRFQTTQEVRAALERPSRGTDAPDSDGVPAADRGPGAPGSSDASVNASIAVLPFVSRSADSEDDYFSDGLSEDLINALSHLSELKVASRTSAFRFRGSNLDVREIGRQLGVGTILEGSVRRAGSRLRVTAQLVSADNGYQLWSERYDRQMADVFEIQDEIVASIVEALVPTLLGEAGPAPTRSTKNLEAYELYLKGRHHWHQRSPATLRVAIQCFEETIKLDPGYALAYAGLADCYGILLVYGWLSAEEGRAPAHAAMTRAVELAPSLWEAHYSRAFYTFYFERDWREAEPHFRKAIAINPRSSLAEVYCGLFLALAGDGEEAVAHAARACELDPLSPLIHGLAGAGFFIQGRFGDAERAATQALELQADYLVGLWLRGLSLSGLGRHEEAIEALERTATLSRAPVFVGVLGLGYARAGRSDDATRLLRELEDRAGRGEYVPPWARLSIHVGQGDLPAMRRALATSLEEATPPLSLQLTGGPLLEEFRTDPEIDRLLFEFYGR